MKELYYIWKMGFEVKENTAFLYFIFMKTQWKLRIGALVWLDIQHIDRTHKNDKENLSL